MLACSKEPIEKSIKESYPVYIVPEEQFCWLMMAVASISACAKTMPKKATQKEQEMLKTNPQGYAFAKKKFEKSPAIRKKIPGSGIKGIYHWQVEAFKKWFFSDSKIQTFKK